MGNILYDAKEDELLREFQLVGPIKQFRLDYEKESGKPKGYGFCEYLDPEYASSALRNLNKQEFKGRKLRVCPASNDKTTLKKGETETEEYQAVLGIDETNVKPSDIIGQCTAKQKCEILKQLMVLTDENPGACSEVFSNKELMQSLTSLSSSIVGQPSAVRPPDAMSGSLMANTRAHMSNHQFNAH